MFFSYLTYHVAMGLIAYGIFAARYLSDPDSNVRYKWTDYDSDVSDSRSSVNIWYCAIGAPIAFIHSLFTLVNMIVRSTYKENKK